MGDGFLDLALGGGVVALTAFLGGVTDFGAASASTPILLPIGLPLDFVVTVNLALLLCTQVSISYKLRRADSTLFRQLGAKIIGGEYSPTFTVDLLQKDTALAMQMAREAEAYPMVGSMVEALHGLARAAGYGQEDTSAVLKLYEEALSGEEGVSE